MKSSISTSKLKVSENLGIVHDLQSVEYVSTLQLCRDYRVEEEVLERERVVEVVVAVGGGEGAVLPVPRDRRLDVEEGEEVGDLVGRRVLEDVAPHHVLMGHEEVLRLLHSELRIHGESTAHSLRT